MQILLIEDDINLSEAVSEFLILHDIDCDFAYTGDTGIKLAQENHYDVILLDLMLPNKNGFEVSKQLRQNGFNTPILMLTASDTPDNELLGFNAGVDDYVLKPCSMPILLARIKALCNRNTPHKNELTLGSLTISYNEHTLSREGKEICLTPLGWKIIELLAKRSPNVVSKLELQEYAWDSHDEIDINTFNVQLHRLRKAIDADHEVKLINTVRGIGISLKA